MTVIWCLFEICVNLFQGFIMVYFAYRYLGGKFGEGYFKNHGTIFSIMLAALITVMNLITVFEHILALSYVIPVFLFSLLCLNGSIMRKLFASVLPVMIVLVASAFVANITALIFDRSLFDLITQPGIHRAVAVLSTQSLILYLSLLCLRIFRKKTENKELYRQEWLIISIILVLGIILGAVLNLIGLEIRTEITSFYVSIGLLVIMILNIVSLAMVSLIGKKNTAIRTAEMNLLKNEYTEQYIRNADTEYELIKKLRHDIKDVYAVASNLLEQGKNAEAAIYLKKVYGLLDHTVSYVKTENAVVNSVINAKLTVAASLGIQAVCMSVEAFKGIDEIDLCRLLSNLLENAITAAGTVQDGEKYIELKITEDLGVYTFLTKNTFAQPISTKNHTLLTSKKDKDHHGYGTKIIQEIADKYHGRFDYYTQNDKFCCTVILSTQS